ncbi:ABC transporter permease subunit [Fluviispira multicolorata]|uniref:ABC transporter permease subunit n=1 Tax=Fluviispira multicolorata TaxID=2654512 RepID=A0A833JCN3_9BACT|nr:ABC transporter permease subunit [Fluviispira multicolorata]KAB8029772.1 ABC transporter permease subunit [Fluviispira multicolorata]
MSSITKRRWNNFLKQKRAKLGIFIFLLLFIFSMTANIWSNSKPIFMLREFDNKDSFLNKKKEIKIYFPLIFYYSPEEFGIIDSFELDYRKLAELDKENNIKNFEVFSLNRWDPEEQTESILAPPSQLHWLGTDNLGRDIFARLLYGTRISLGFALILWIISYFIGILLGAMQGYYLGAFDFILERVKELAAIIPMLTIIILVTAITKNQTFFMILCLVLIFGWMGIASQIRANVLTLRQREFCEASLALGGTHFRVLMRHIFPNILSIIITLSPFAIEVGISLLAALDYLGFGLPPPTPSIGELMAQGRDNIQNAPWVLISPIVIILLLLTSISLIGQSLREAFDPKLS